MDNQDKKIEEVKEKIEEIQEILFILMDEIVRLKEESCENSGWNWRDEIKPLVDKLDTPVPSARE